jgi:hypothetical protein
MLKKKEMFILSDTEIITVIVIFSRTSISPFRGYPKLTYKVRAHNSHKSEGKVFFLSFFIASKIWCLNCDDSERESF